MVPSLFAQCTKCVIWNSGINVAGVVGVGASTSGVVGFSFSYFIGFSSFESMNTIIFFYVDIVVIFEISSTYIQVPIDLLLQTYVVMWFSLYHVHPHVHHELGMMMVNVFLETVLSNAQCWMTNIYHHLSFLVFFFPSTMCFLLAFISIAIYANFSKEVSIFIL